MLVYGRHSLKAFVFPQQDRDVPAKKALGISSICRNFVLQDLVKNWTDLQRHFIGHMAEVVFLIITLGALLLTARKKAAM